MLPSQLRPQTDRDLWVMFLDPERDERTTAVVR